MESWRWPNRHGPGERACACASAHIPLLVPCAVIPDLPSPCPCLISMPVHQTCRARHCICTCVEHSTAHKPTCHPIPAAYCVCAQLLKERHDRISGGSRETGTPSLPVAPRHSPALHNQPCIEPCARIPSPPGRPCIPAHMSSEWRVTHCGSVLADRRSSLQKSNFTV